MRGMHLFTVLRTMNKHHFIVKMMMTVFSNTFVNNRFSILLSFFVIVISHEGCKKKTRLRKLLYCCAVYRVCLMWLAKCKLYFILWLHSWSHVRLCLRHHSHRNVLHLWHFFKLIYLLRQAPDGLRSLWFVVRHADKYVFFVRRYRTLWGKYVQPCESGWLFVTLNIVNLWV